MAWNEPGDKNNKDPWSGQGGGQQPPDIDEVVKQLKNKFGGLFGNGGSGNSGSGNNAPSMSFSGFIAILAIVLVIWLLSGFYSVDQGKRGLVLRFGKHIDTTEPGLHWIFPYPVDKVQMVDVERLRFKEIGYRSTGTTQQLNSTVPKEALMLTKDENIIDVRLAVTYKIKSAKNFVFNVRDPDLTIKQATESAIREIIGQNTMDFILKEGRSEIAVLTKSLAQKILDRYKTGIIISAINMQDLQPPEEVQDAFTDAIKAREDEVRQKKEAEAYENDLIPKARGAAARIIEEANAYKAKVTTKAEGEANRFTKLLVEYEKAPDVTRERLYIDTIESVLGNTSKVMMDVKNGNNLMYLPIDKLIERKEVPANIELSIPQNYSGNTSSANNQQRQNVRLRENQRESQRGRSSR
ncbi:MAG: FtsH protease activity modulator HflK [Methylococcales bacterium]|jgi:membrane protease subunit HflK|nr:FtsH protease activity modulator HflK [Methylococcales bacterium]MBT7411335.1 FtsH protease activity modulator HflK [Methylococcales bacterium]